jgi:integrase
VAKVSKKNRGKNAPRRARTEWVVRWVDPAGREKMKSFGTRAEADAFATNVENKKLRGDYHDPRLGRELLGEFYESRWLPRAKLRMAPSTLGLLEGHWKLYVEPAFAQRRLNSVTAADLRIFADQMIDEASVYQAETSLRLLRSIFRAALEDGLLGRSPADGVSAPRRPHHKNRYLTEDEIAKLVDAHPDRWRAFVLVAAYGGLRFGELVGLRVEHVDFFRRKLRVEEALVEAGGKLHERPTKSGKTRMVTLPRFVMAAVSEHLRSWPADESGRVFSDDNGGPVRRSTFYKRIWWPAIKRAGLQKLRFHDLRHTSAALAIAAGAHPKTIQMRLGHHSAAFTLDVYGGLFESLDEDLAEKLDIGAKTADLPIEDAGEQRGQVIEFRLRSNKGRGTGKRGGP